MDDCCVCQPAAFWQQRIAEKIGPFNEDLDFPNFATVSSEDKVKVNFISWMKQ